METSKSDSKDWILEVKLANSESEVDETNGKSVSITGVIIYDLEIGESICMKSALVSTTGIIERADEVVT